MNLNMTGMPWPASYDMIYLLVMAIVVMAIVSFFKVMADKEERENAPENQDQGGHEQH